MLRRYTCKLADFEPSVAVPLAPCFRQPAVPELAQARWPTSPPASEHCFDLQPGLAAQPAIEITAAPVAILWRRTRPWITRPWKCRISSRAIPNCASRLQRCRVDGPRSPDDNGACLPPLLLLILRCGCFAVVACFRKSTQLSAMVGLLLGIMAAGWGPRPGRATIRCRMPLRVHCAHAER
jgi:hypothetical protein